MSRDYRNIKAWQLADRLVIGIYKITTNFPKTEIFSLTNQLRRAAVSVPTNIVEGSGRGYIKDYLKFLYIARGSLKEVEYLLRLSHELSYLNEESFNEANLLCLETLKTLFGLIQSVESEAK